MNNVSIWILCKHRAPALQKCPFCVRDGLPTPMTPEQHEAAVADYWALKAAKAARAAERRATARRGERHGLHAVAGRERSAV
jgi:hypothetical protein